MQKENGLIVIDPKEYGLEESKAQEISLQFKPMLDKMVELETEFNEVVKLPIEEMETSKRAKELRLKYVKVRTGTEVIHKAQKAFYLAGGRFVDGWKNAQLFASQGIESKLESIENYAIIKEKERIAKLQKEREDMLMPFEVENVSSLNLGTMTDGVWSNFLTGTQTNYNLKKELEQKAIEEQLAKEKAEIEERERIHIENETLKAEALAKEKELAKERAKVEAERKALEEKNRKEKEAIEAKLKAEALAKEKLEKELKEKQEAETRALNEKLASAERELKEAEKLAKAPIKKQLKVWVESFVLPETNVDNDVSKSINDKFNAFKEWSLKQIETV